MSLKRWRIALLCAAGVLVNTLLACNLFLPRAWQGRNDFMGFYAGAQLAGTPNLYDRDSIGAAHLRAVGETGEIQYGRPPYYAWILKPLGRLPYRTAYTVWAVLMAASFCGFLALWPGVAARTKWLVGCWSIPAFVCLFNGQDDLLLLLCAALAAWLLRRDKPLAAGLILTLCASKYHLFMLVPLVIVAQRRWRMAAGAAIGVCLELALSFAVAGKQWPWRYYDLVAHPGINTGLPHMPNLHSLFGTSLPGIALQVIATLALAAGVFLAARRTSLFEPALGLALAAGVLAGYHGYLHDCALLLPGILAFFSAAPRDLRIPVVALASPVPWFLLQLPWPLPAVTQLLILAFAAAGILTLAWGPAAAPREFMPSPALP
jgi:hypothetical protein